MQMLKLITLIFKKLNTDSQVNHEWFVYPAVEQVKEDLIEKYKYTEDEVEKEK